MTSEPIIPSLPERAADHAALIAALISTGWTKVSEPDKYVRLCGPEDQRTVLVPTNPAMADYVCLLGELVESFRREASAGRLAQQVLDALSPTRQAPDAPSGPTVAVTEYTVSLLPEGHRDHRHLRVRISYDGGDLWTVEHCGYFLTRDGQWHPGAGHGDRFELDDALWMAKQAAPAITVNGLTAADVLARSRPST